MLCCVWCCVVCVVWRVARLGTQKKPPCVDSKRPRVYRHHAHTCYHMCAWCRYTRGRFEWTHSGAGEGHRQFCLPKFAHVGSSRASEVHHKKPMDLTHFQFENRSREQHVADSSKHSLCLMKLLRDTAEGISLERRSTPSARRPVPVPFLHVHLLRSQTTRFSAPPTAVSTHTARVWRVSCIPFATHLARTLRLPWLLLVGLCPPRLDGGLSSFAMAHLSGNSHLRLVSADALHLFTSSLGTQLRVEPPAFVVVPVPSFPHTEQLLLILMHEFHHLGLTQPFVLNIFMGVAAHPACILRFLPPFPHFEVVLIIQVVPLLLWLLGAPRRLGHADACQCICFATVHRLVARWLSFAHWR